MKTPVISDLIAVAARQREVENALLVQALFGRLPTPAAQARLANYVAGRLPRAEAFADFYEPVSGRR